MKPFILCLDPYSAVEEIKTIIRYHDRLESIYNFSDELFLWKYAYINWKGIYNIDPNYWDMEGTEKYEFFITIHLCKSYINILQYAKDGFEKGILTNILGYTASSIVYILTNKDYVKRLYNVCPIDHNHPITIDKEAFDHTKTTGVDPVYD